MTAQLFAIIAPVFIIAGFGLGWRRLHLPFDTATVTAIATNLGTPALILATLSKLEVSAEAFAEMLFGKGRFDMNFRQRDIANGQDAIQRFSGAGQVRHHPDRIRRKHRRQRLERFGRRQHDEALLTIFSAPNYCYRCGNRACIMEVNAAKTKVFLQFDAAPKRGELYATYAVPSYFS